MKQVGLVDEQHWVHLVGAKLFDVSADREEDGGTRPRDDRVQHDSKRVSGRRGTGERPGERGSDLLQRAAVEGQHPVDQTWTLARFTPSAPVSISSRASVASTGTPVSPGLGSRFATTSRGVLTTSATLST